MKIYIVCDIEGTAGVVDFKKQCTEDGSYYRQATALATQELNALIEGVIEAGASEIFAWPGHGDFPGGVDPEFLHPQCRLVMNAGDGGPDGFDESFDAMLMLGLHAMAGTEDGVLSHSFTPLIKDFQLNGVRMGEIGFNMATFGEKGVPCVFISGDKAAVDEAKSLVPLIEGATVKWGLSEKYKLGALSVRKSVSLSPIRSREVIRDAGKRSLERIGEIAPYRLTPPYTLRVEYTDTKYTEAPLKASGMTRLNATTLTQTRQRLQDLIF